MYTDIYIYRYIIEQFLNHNDSINEFVIWLNLQVAVVLCMQNLIFHFTYVFECTNKTHFKEEI